MSTTTPITEQLYAMSADGPRARLVRAEPIEMNPARFGHGVISVRLAHAWFELVERRGLGVVDGPDLLPGFQLNAEGIFPKT